MLFTDILASTSPFRKCFLSNLSYADFRAFLVTPQFKNFPSPQIFFCGFTLSSQHDLIQASGQRC